MIKAVGRGKYIVKGLTSKTLSRPVSKKKAEERLRQVEFFKNKGKRSKRP